jgi:hypothetical protein
MRIKKNYTSEEILDATVVGVEFEFFSEIENGVDIARSIGKFLGKRVVVPMVIKGLDNEKLTYHSSVKPTDSVFKLELDYSGGKKMRELVTGTLSYKESRSVIIKMLEWITNNGYTNNRCAIHLNINIDNKKLPTRHQITSLPMTKFILSFDENKVYDKFPDRKDNVYARSIKQIGFNDILFYNPTLVNYGNSILNFPNEEKYYGVNFTKLHKGYLEYRYLGGEGYERKTKKILEILEYFVMHLYETLNSEGLTELEISDFKKMTDANSRNYRGFVKYEVFKSIFPDIKVSVDLKNDGELLEAYWGNIRDTLFKLINTGGLRKGMYNYDTEMARHQIQSAKIKNCKVENVEFLECELEGVIDHCWFYNCKIKNSRFFRCEFLKNNRITSSKVTECILHASNTLDDCYVENKNMIINCEMKGGVIRNGEIGKLAKISKETVLVSKSTNTPDANMEDGDSERQTTKDKKSEKKENKKEK